MSEYQVLRLVRERDAARAEVAALRERLDAEIRESEVARRHAEVLADLRAKVEALPDALTGDIPATVLDSADVLALLEEES